MKRNDAIPIGAFFVSLFAAAFCIWTALGNDLNICFSAGCSLFEDFSVAEISLWWPGTIAFAALAILALAGLSRAGTVLSALCLGADCFLLALMALTAPCVNCLIVAAFFALAFFLFRNASRDKKIDSRPSPLIWIWAALFVINIGATARSQLDIWPMLDESGDPKTRVFFSPSCKFCVQAINSLSGNVNAAFYPVAENDDDIARIDKMNHLIQDGMGIAEALGQTADIKADSTLQTFAPSLIFLRFRLLRNKAHIFMAGSRGVPFIEQKGLPPQLNKNSSQIQSEKQSGSTQDYSQNNLMKELNLDDAGGQCAGKPCP